MNDKLKEIEEVFIGQVQKSDSVLGAWRFGSETHGLSDDLSDVDIVLLIDGNYFDKSINEMEKYIENSCDEIYLCYPEEFNGEAIINNGYLISKDNDIFQFDIFLLHSGHLEDFDKNRENILYCMKTFAEDTKEICRLKNEEYNECLANRMIKFFS